MLFSLARPKANDLCQSRRLHTCLDVPRYDPLSMPAGLVKAHPSPQNHITHHLPNRPNLYTIPAPGAACPCPSTLKPPQQLGCPILRSLTAEGRSVNIPLPALAPAPALCLCLCLKVGEGFSPRIKRQPSPPLHSAEGLRAGEAETKIYRPCRCFCLTPRPRFDTENKPRSPHIAPQHDHANTTPSTTKSQQSTTNPTSKKNIKSPTTKNHPNPSVKMKG